MPNKRALTTEEVIEMAVDFVGGTVTISALARKYGVSRTTISDALYGRGAYARIYALLPAERLVPVLAYRTAARANRLHPQEAAQLRARFRKGETLGELAVSYEISKTQVSRIVRGVAYRLAGGPVYNPKRG